MFTVLVTSFLLFAVISYAIYWWQRSPSNADAGRVLPPSRMSGLFGEISKTEELALLSAEKEARDASERAALLERAAQGDKRALQDAQTSDKTGLYDAVLDTLVEQADSEPKLLSLVSYIARGEGLRVNQKLAARFIESWKNSPDRSSTAKMLHIAALSGDADVYRQAVEIAASFQHDGRVPSLSADELRQLVESEYWILPAASRNSGAGFVLKQTLARLRRELAATATSHESSLPNREG